MDAMRPAWERLYAASPHATLFQSFGWNRWAAESFADRETPHVVLAESGSGAAIIPAAVRQNSIVLLGDSLFDYRDALCAGDAEALCAAFGTLAEFRMPLALMAVRGDARSRWEGLHPEPFVGAPQVRCDETDAEKFAGDHARLQRSLRRLERAGVRLQHHCGSAATLVREIYRAKGAHPIEGASNLFGDARRVDFMVGACALHPDQCDVYTLNAEGELVAALVTFRDRGARRFYTVYFDLAWEKYSPGVALVYEVTRQSLAEGLDCDYMTGEQPHKMRFATSTVRLYKVNATADVLGHFARPVEQERLAA